MVDHYTSTEIHLVDTASQRVRACKQHSRVLFSYNSMAASAFSVIDTLRLVTIQPDKIVAIYNFIRYLRINSDVFVKRQGVRVVMGKTPFNA